MGDWDGPFARVAHWDHHTSVSVFVLPRFALCLLFGSGDVYTPFGLGHVRVTGRSWYIDIGMAWALQSFIGSLALAKYLEGKGLEE
jgi:hypothetical protein